ncbi:MAG: PAAR domain-containing protein, partial [Alphaproteobacteria bacterium]
PQCKGMFPIAEGDAHCKIEGAPVAFDGHKTACGAALISSV